MITRSLRSLLPQFFRRAPTIESHVEGNHVALLRNGEVCLPQMLRAIENAKREIVLEMYWFDADIVGRWFAETLMHKAKSGVTVRVIFDAIGSFGVDRQMFDEMRAAGCEVHEFNPISSWKKRLSLDMLNRRDHRKILVVDGRLAFTGGVNIALLWAPKPMGGAWRDDMVSIEGPAASQLRDVFYEMWIRLDRRGRRSLRVDRLSAAPDSASSSVRVLANFRRGDRHAIRKAYLREIRRAKRVVFLANSYFIPDRAIRHALAQAVARGVDVRVLTAGNTDVVAARSAARFLYHGMLRHGVHIYEWTETVFHSKTAVIDDHCIIGTYNIDHRSWRLNWEVNVDIVDAELSRQMCDVFTNDASISTPILLENWEKRPWMQRAIDAFFYLFHKML